MRSLSERALLAINMETTQEVPLFLLRIFPPGETDPANAIRLVNDIQGVTASGLDYIPFAFDLVLPDDDGKNLPTVNLDIDNVSLELAEAVLSWLTPVNVEVELVLAATPDTVETGPWFFIGAAAVLRDSSITIELRYEDILNEPFPADRMTPQNFPGLYAR